MKTTKIELALLMELFNHRHRRRLRRRRRSRSRSLLRQRCQSGRGTGGMRALCVPNEASFRRAHLAPIVSESFLRDGAETRELSYQKMGTWHGKEKKGINLLRILILLQAFH